MTKTFNKVIKDTKVINEKRKSYVLENFNNSEEFI